MAAAVGEPDEYAGELPVAFVTLKPGARADAASIAAAIEPHIAERPAVPRRIDILESMPMTAIGKVYKPALRARATQRALDERLARAGLAGLVSVHVEDGASGLVVRFNLTDRTADGTADATLDERVRELMKPFALAYSVERGGQL